jgi:CubicO group peptidase (beta-lactamase class C family)
VDPVIEEISEQLEREIDLLCRKAKAIGASIGIVRDGKLAWTYGYGYKDLAGDDAPTPDTLFRVASITKSFTATAIFMLRDRGLLDINDALATHIPEFSKAIPRKAVLEDVTLRRMMCHLSGLSCETPTGDPYWESGNWPSIEEMLDVIDQTEVVIESDSAHKYSNFAYGLLGEVIARVSGRSYVDFVTSEILQPLGMHSTAFEPSAELMSRAAVGYTRTPYEDAPRVAPHASLGGQMAAGQLYTTVEDLVLWVNLHLGPKEKDNSEDDIKDQYTDILSARSRKEMQRTQFMKEDLSSGVGMPWEIGRLHNNTVRGHGGVIQGYISQLNFIAGRRLGVITLFNRLLNTAKVNSKIIEMLSEAEDAHAAGDALKKPSPTPPEIQEYLGLYFGTFELIRKVETRNGMLHYSTSVGVGEQAGPPIALEPTDEPDSYRPTTGRQSGDLFVFNRSTEGAITSITSEAMVFRKLVQVEE